MKTQILLLFLSLSLIGCIENSRPKYYADWEEGKVISEQYIQPKMKRQLNSDLINGTQETVAIGSSKYIIKVETSKRVYTINIWDSGYPSFLPKETLMEELEIEDRVRFKIGVYTHKPNGEITYTSQNFKNYVGSCEYIEEVYKVK